MKTWDYWSDEEVNACVTKLVYDLYNLEYSDNMKQFYHCGITGDETHTQPIIDYCNNPADMWPIMFENGIGIWPITRHRPNFWCAKFFGSGATFLVETFSFECDNPLRAAAIVFLMMNGVTP